ncbi:hypothetical protein ACTJIJ_02705 [Niabella sp. 22666]
MKKALCFIAVASLLLTTTVSYCKNDKREVEEESGNNPRCKPF